VHTRSLFFINTYKPHFYFRYKVLELLGCGTFGQVAKCKNELTGEMVAVKVIKNKPAYLKQSMIEVEILKQVSLF
jgi:dual specificity protein kinase YAK1